MMAHRASLRADLASAFASPSGVSLVVHDWGGDGDPVLLAHPTGFHGRAWAPVAAKLVARRPARLVVRLPRPRRQRPVTRRHVPLGGVRRRRARGDAPPRPRRRPAAARGRALEGRRVAALGRGRASPGTYPRIWTLRADHHPGRRADPRRARTTRSRTARAGGATSGRHARRRSASYGVEAAAERARAGRARGVRRLRDARPARRHRRAQVPARGRGDDVHDGREPRPLPAARRGRGARCSSRAGDDTTSITPEMAGRSRRSSRTATLEVWERPRPLRPARGSRATRSTSMLRFAVATAT